MIIEKTTITGKKGKTVIYSPKFEVNEETLSWEGFRFYTPVGTAVDTAGFHYFDAPAGEIVLEREKLSKTLLIIVTQETGVQAIEIYAGAEAQMDPITIGLEGDIVATGHIPTDPNEEISIQFKKVLNEQ